MFINSDDYVRASNQTQATLTIEISETSYYIKNVQSPIAKKPEVIFRTLLFTFLCLEVFAMTFLLIKLLLLPVYRKLKVHCKRLCKNRRKRNHEPAPDYE